MSANTPSLPPEIFGGIGMDGRQLRSYVGHNALELIEAQQVEIEQLRAEVKSIRSATARLILSFCEGRHSELNQLHGAGWNSAMSFVKSRILREVLGGVATHKTCISEYQK